MSACPRIFAAGENPGYYSATLPTAGVSVPFPKGSSGCIVSCLAPIYIGVRDSSTVATPGPTTYGVIMQGQPYEFSRGTTLSSQGHLHLAAVSGTTTVSVVFI